MTFNKKRKVNTRLHDMTQTLKELLYNAAFLFFCFVVLQTTPLAGFSIILMEDFDNFVKKCSIHTVIAPCFYFYTEWFE